MIEAAEQLVFEQRQIDRELGQIRNSTQSSGTKGARDFLLTGH
jgi:hypothetical protein